MREFKYADRVLLEGVVINRPDYEDIVIADTGETGTQVRTGRESRHVHHHPGVPVADLEEELDEVWDLVGHLRQRLAGRGGGPHAWTNDRSNALHALRDARLSAKGPKEVWVKAMVGPGKCITIRTDPDDLNISDTWELPVHPDDVREEDPS